MPSLLMLGLCIPVFGFLILMLNAHWLSRRLTAIIGCGTVLISFICFFLIFWLTGSDNITTTVFLFNWIPLEAMHADISIRIDSLSLLMTLIITGIGSLIHIYSIGYIEHDEDYARYFACLNLFIFAMLLLVLADSLLLLFVGWEGVGLASYLLIGYWYTRPAAAQSATKAFIVNRIGDCGLLLGIILTFYLFGTTNISEIIQKGGQQFAVDAPILSLLTLLYFVGAVGKSAQIPLHTWLPDAMEGPTPVSALIHAATMVTAGIYLVVRLNPLFTLAPAVLNTIGDIGALTAIFAALSAIGQTDLKRVLAYSTISQLGLMFLACSAGAFYTAMFHLTTHAFIKALLFLSAGNVIHMMQGTTDMDKMGGLWKKFTKTHWLFLIGVLAMSGIPPLSAFFSKDLILEEEYETGYLTLFYLGLLTSTLTGFYLIRAYCLTFLGKSHLQDNILKYVKEAPNLMLLPVYVLAFLSLFGGFLGVSFHNTPLLEKLLLDFGMQFSEYEFAHGMIFSPITLVSIIGATAAIIIGFWMYTNEHQRSKKPLAILKNGFFIDSIYEIIVVKPLKWLSNVILFTFEPRLFDRAIHFTTTLTQSIATTFQNMQSGQIRSYAAWMVVGLGFLIFIYLF